MHIGRRKSVFCLCLYCLILTKAFSRVSIADFGKIELKYTGTKNTVALILKLCIQCNAYACMHVPFT